VLTDQNVIPTIIAKHSLIDKKIIDYA